MRFTAMVCLQWLGRCRDRHKQPGYAYPVNDHKVGDQTTIFCSAVKESQLDADCNAV